MSTPLLEIANLAVAFGASRAVDDVSLTVREGQTLALVGESGSGKSVTSLAVMRLIEPAGRIVSGRLAYRRRNGDVAELAKCTRKEMRLLRGREIAMIFQEPMSSLNPLFTIGDQIAEMVLLHEPVSRKEALARARRMLDLVEIPDAARRLDDYPHQMSGGMRQRVMIAIALACSPRLLIADEPTTALDVTIQAQILDLLRRLQRDMQTGILFITHNLGVVAEIASEVAVMYAGRIVEQAPVAELFATPRHPYTRALFACIPGAGARPPARSGGTLASIPGTVPPLSKRPSGCTFAPRCTMAAPECAKEPPFRRLGLANVRCVRAS